MKQLRKIFIIAVLFILGCSNSPEPISYGQDNCEHCKMLITDVKYGAELVSDKGKVYKFDSIECLIGFEKKMNNQESNNLFVIDFSTTGKLIDAKKAYYVSNDKFHSPMGLNVLAVSDKKEADKILGSYGGELLNWEKVVYKASEKSSINM